MNDMPGMAGMKMDKQPASDAMPGMDMSAKPAMPGMNKADSSAKPAVATMAMSGMKGEGDMKMGGMKGMSGMKKAPLGTFVTGATQLQAAYPAETLLNYEMLKAPQPTTIPAGRCARCICT
jgi:hypothetical protein